MRSLTAVFYFLFVVLKKPVIQIFDNTSFVKSFGSPIYCDESRSFSTGNIIAMYEFYFAFL